MGLATVLGLGRQGFFIPHRYADVVRPIAYPALEPLFAAALPHHRALLAHIETLGSALRAMGGPAPAPRFDQGWFPRLDAAAAYAMVARNAPRRIVEIGSGHSTRFLARAVRDRSLKTTITCIDPAPRAPLSGLPVTWQRTRVQEAPDEVFLRLEAGDVLFIDSSHILVPGSDVDILLGRVLPRLPARVLVHVHDIFLPDPYPETWAWRGYNEQSAIGALLQGGGYAVRFASHYLCTRHASLLEGHLVATLPQQAEGYDSSLWLEKMA